MSRNRGYKYFVLSGDYWAHAKIDSIRMLFVVDDKNEEKAEFVREGDSCRIFVIHSFCT